MGTASILYKVIAISMIGILTIGFIFYDMGWHYPVEEIREDLRKRMRYTSDERLNIYTRPRPIASKSKYRREPLLRATLEKMFPGYKFPTVRPDWNPGYKGSNLEIDCFCYCLAFGVEHNGIQHYEYTPHFHKNGISDLHDQVKRDKCKMENCEKLNIPLVIIRYDLPEDKFEEEVYKQLKEIGWKDPGGIYCDKTCNHI